MNSERKFSYRADIDGLRAIAILSVLIFHFFPKVLRRGFIGVDIFFVISGYLIGSILLNSLSQGKFSFKEFYQKRIIRLFPSLIVVLLLTLVMGFFLFFPVELKYLFKHISASAFFLNNFLLYSEVDYFDKSADFKPLLHMWSLSIEEQFYIFIPLFMWGIYKKINWLKWILTTLTILSLFYCIYLLKINASASFYFPHSRFFELSSGILVAIFEKDLMSIFKINSKKSQYSWVGIGFLILSLLIVKKSVPFPGLGSLIPIVGTILLILTSKSSFNKKILSNKYLVHIGLLSYPLYLIHWPLIVFFKEKFIDLDWSLNALILVLTYIIAFLLFRYVETPIKKFGNKSKVATCLFVTMICLGILTYSLSKGDGFPKRFPNEIQNLISSYDFKFEHYARFNTCHFNGEKKYHSYTLDCVELGSSKKFFIWGDSFAAALYPGFKKLQEKIDFGIIQKTTCGAPPFGRIWFDNACLNRTQMIEKNKEALSLVLKSNPTHLILHAYWQNYGTPEIVIGELKNQIKILGEKLPDLKIIIIGPVPIWGTWDKGLIPYSIDYWKKYKQMPEYMDLGLHKDLFDYDKKFQAAFREKNVHYLSVVEKVCNSELKCRAMLGRTIETMMSFDLGHLTKGGSEYLIERLFEANI